MQIIILVWSRLINGGKLLILSWCNSQIFYFFFPWVNFSVIDLPFIYMVLRILKITPSFRSRNRIKVASYIQLFSSALLTKGTQTKKFKSFLWKILTVDHFCSNFDALVKKKKKKKKKSASKFDSLVKKTTTTTTKIYILLVCHNQDIKNF